MAKSERTNTKESVFKAIINILEEQGVICANSTDTRVLGVRKHDILEMINQLSIFVNKDQQFPLIIL